MHIFLCYKVTYRSQNELTDGMKNKQLEKIIIFLYPNIVNKFFRMTLHAHSFIAFLSFYRYRYLSFLSLFYRYFL